MVSILDGLMFPELDFPECLRSRSATFLMHNYVPGASCFRSMVSEGLEVELEGIVELNGMEYAVN